jgi:hypothetical protein|tara:strand:- start:1922 stop:2218 length:297 start_codon:yes stop_codon:yes gene_type:complete
MPKFTVRQTFTIVRTCEVEAETEIDATDFIANSCVENHCAEHEWPVPPYLESSGYAKTITRMDEEYYEATYSDGMVLLSADGNEMGLTIERSDTLCNG